MQEPKTVLLIEDNEPDMVLIQRKVKTIWPECNVISAHSLEEAYKASDENEIDMILLDLNLPDGFGASTVEEMRKYNDSVPIVVITGLATDVVVCESLKKGANNVVLKSQIFDGDFFNILKQNAEQIS